VLARRAGSWHQFAPEEPPMYYAVIRQFAKTLGNLDAILGKAAAHADARKFSADNYCTLRLAPDMLPFTRQITIASDAAKNAAALLAGREPPKFEDNETTFAELRARIAKTLAYLNTFSAKDFEATTPRTEIKMVNPPGKAMYADDALLSRSLPNFYFHVM